MIKFLQCNIYGCANELLTVSEVKGRMCEGHRHLALEEKSYVGVCWYCSYPTALGDREWDEQKGEYLIKDKYIMSKGCEECTGNKEDNISWMTIPSESAERIISDIAVMEITHQNNQLFTDYQRESSN